MLKILNAEQVKKVDRETIEEEGILSSDLMERAALSIYEASLEYINPQKPVYVFAGIGNNGGDVLAVARMLLTSDIKPVVFIVGDSSKMSEDCLLNKERLERLISVHKVESIKDIPLLEENGVVIDGLFGSGLNRPLEGFHAEVVNHINNSGCKILSIDMPSGMFVDDNTENDKSSIVKADVVFSLQMPKLSLLLPESSDYCKEMKMLDIGLSKKAIGEKHTDLFFTEKEDISKFIKIRNKFSHKGNYGHALLVAGSKGKTGAAVLASSACLRSGVGLLTIHAPKCSLDILQATVPEAMVNVDVSSDCISQIDIDVENYTVGVGCGIGTSVETKKALAKLIGQCHKPMVLDADALNIIATNDELKYNLPEGSILTPHPVEFERLAGKHFLSGYERLQHAREFAMKCKVYIVLKGAYTAIITPEKKVYFNPTGNPGMATGGSGDALTGIITSLLAQKYNSFQAALLGVYLHGLAGDLAAKAKSQYSMLPSDLINYLGKSYRILVR